MDEPEWPVRDEVADMSFFSSLDPHFGHFGVIEENTKISLTSLQLWHSYSYIGISIPLLAYKLISGRNCAHVRVRVLNM